jgi:hypothetical protein
MPTRCLSDSEGCYCRWGGHGAKYRYKCGDDAGRSRARSLADKQGQAAHAHGYGKKAKVIGGFRTN